MDFEKNSKFHQDLNFAKNLFWNERQPTFLGHPTTFFLGSKFRQI